MLIILDVEFIKLDRINKFWMIYIQGEGSLFGIVEQIAFSFIAIVFQAQATENCFDFLENSLRNYGSFVSKLELNFLFEMLMRCTCDFDISKTSRVISMK